MRHIQVFFGDDGTRVASERVENDHDDLSLEFTCQKCGQVNRLDLEAAHEQLPTTINCKSGCLVTVRLHKEHEDQDYLLQVAAMERDPEGLIPMIFHDFQEYKVSVGKWLAMFDGRSDDTPHLNALSWLQFLLCKSADGTYTKVTRQFSDSDAGNSHLEEFFVTYPSAKDLVGIVLFSKEMGDHVGDMAMVTWYLALHDLIKEAAKNDAGLADAMTLREIEIHE